MERRTFLTAALAGGIGLPAAGIGLARAVGRDESLARPARPLPLPRDGVIRTAFLLGPHVNVIDTAGPWEVFQDAGAGTGGSSAFALYTVAETTDPVEATGGLTIVPEHECADAPQPNVVVVPAQHSSDLTRTWLRRVAPEADVVMSVCTGAFVLGDAGLLDGLTATTHHDFFSQFESSFPRATLIRGERFVEHERIATAAGLTSGIDLALRVVERYFGRDAAVGTAEYMEHESTRWRSA